MEATDPKQSKKTNLYMTAPNTGPENINDKEPTSVFVLISFGHLELSKPRITFWSFPAFILDIVLPAERYDVVKGGCNKNKNH